MPFECQNFVASDGIQENTDYTLSQIFIKKGSHVYRGKKICELSAINAEKKCILSIKAKCGGNVSKLFLKLGDKIQIGETFMEVEVCSHPTLLGNICCDCGVILEDQQTECSTNKNNGLVSMLHSIPDLKVSKEEAKRLGTEDRKHLLENKKLVLLVDLDQTLIHTTNDNIPAELKDVFHFKLNPKGPWYHTRLRPFTRKFLESISKHYELHICTFGVREYAHFIARFIDSDKHLFGERILSRNEYIDPMSKKGNLNSLFPCGDDLVCIIDDRSDVWNFAPNVVQVLPYHFFQNTGDINAPPGLQKKENDVEKGIDFSKIKVKKSSSCDSSSDSETKSDSEEESRKCDSEGSVKSDSEDCERTESENKSDFKCVKSETEGPSHVEVKDDEEVETKQMSDDVVKTLSEDEESTKEEKSDSKASKEYKNVADENDSSIEVEDNDDYLLYLEDILVKLHAKFYDQYKATGCDPKNLPDIKRLVVQEKKKVLNSCNLVFSGVVPQHTELRNSKAYHIARSLGATITNDLKPKTKLGQNNNSNTTTTHLIAANLHTQKVHEAKKIKNCKIVTPNWLWCCAERWEKVDERLFPLDSLTEKTLCRAPPIHCLVSHKIIEMDQLESIASTSDNEGDLTPEGSHNLMDSLNPLAFLSDDEAKSMEQEVDVELSDDDEGPDSKRESIVTESDSDSPKTDESVSDDVEMLPNSKKRRLSLDDDDEDQSDDEELPSIRFRQGGQLSSEDESDDDAYGDILAKQLME